MNWGKGCDAYWWWSRFLSHFPYAPDCSLCCVDRSRIRDERPLLSVQFVFDGILWYTNTNAVKSWKQNLKAEPPPLKISFCLYYLHDIFDEGCPSGELVRALCTLLPIWQRFPSIAALTHNETRVKDTKAINFKVHSIEIVVKLQSRHLPQLWCCSPGSAGY